MNYFDKINKQLIVLSALCALLTLLLANWLSYIRVLGDLLLNLCAALITATAALLFVGYVRHKDVKEKNVPAYRLAKSSIQTTLFGTLIDLGQVYGHVINPNDFFNKEGYKEIRSITNRLVKNLKAIKYVKTDLDFEQLPARLHSEARRNIYEIDQIWQLYSFVLPLEVKIKLLEVRADYKELEFVLSINPPNTKHSKAAKTIISVSIFRLKMSVVGLYLLLDSLGIDETIHLVDE